MNVFNWFNKWYIPPDVKFKDKIIAQGSINFTGLPGMFYIYQYCDYGHPVVKIKIKLKPMYVPEKKPEPTGETCPVCGLTVTEYSLFMGRCVKGHSLKKTTNETNNSNRDTTGTIRNLPEQPG